MKIFFTPGPSQIYPTVAIHLQEALEQNILSISHRSTRFQEIVQETLANLRQLLTIPDQYHIFFLSSATEAMERTIENCVEKKSLHIVAGSFGDKWYDIAKDLQKDVQKYTIDLTNIFTNNFTIKPGTELICLTQNETSNGWAMPLKSIYSIRQQYPHPLLAVDIVSSVPYINIDYTKLDIAFFSVQKGFGLPAGLGILIVSPRAFEKAQYLQNRGVNIGSYHNFISLEKHMRDYQTPETPNVLGIFLFNEILKDLLNQGIDTLRKETEEKAQLLYSFLEENKYLKPAISIKEHRSQTVIVAKGEKLPELVNNLARRGFIVGKGYGKAKDKEIRIANFPTHKKKEIVSLLSNISEIVNLL